MSESKVILELTIEQAAVNRKALDLFARLSIGQLEELTELVRDGYLPHADDTAARRGEYKKCDLELVKSVDNAVNVIKEVLGHPAYGSHGIHNDKVSDYAKSAWEIKKTMDQAIANHVAPNPPLSERTVDYDGAPPGLTKGPAPKVSVIVGAAAEQTNTTGPEF